MKSRVLVLALVGLVLRALLAAEEPSKSADLIGVAPAALRLPLSDSWPTYSGDYSGRRYSALTQLNRTNVKHLGLEWVAKLATGRTIRPGGSPIQVGGHGPEDGAVPAPANVKGSILQVNGVLFVTAPDYVWAIDARDGRELWRYDPKPRRDWLRYMCCGPAARGIKLLKHLTSGAAQRCVSRWKARKTGGDNQRRKRRVRLRARVVVHLPQPNRCFGPPEIVRIL
jgi:glucose dehydrogenase